MEKTNLFLKPLVHVAQITHTVGMDKQWSRFLVFNGTISPLLLGRVLLSHGICGCDKRFLKICDAQRTKTIK